jgi:hypothetical protein
MAQDCSSGKRSFPTRAAARGEMRRLQSVPRHIRQQWPARPDHDRATMPIRVYRCELCGAWHMTSKPKRKPAAQKGAA